MKNEQLVIRKFGSEAILRRATAELARFACNGEIGRSVGDPVFDSITLNRGHSQSYAASGDLPNFVLGALGVRDHRLVSRSGCEDGCLPWALGRNLCRIVFPKSGMFVWATQERRPKVGDILYTTSPERVSILAEVDERAQWIAVFEYGRREPRRLLPAGVCDIRRFKTRGKALFVDDSRLRGWFDVTKIPGILSDEALVVSNDQECDEERPRRLSSVEFTRLSSLLVQAVRSKSVAG